MLTMQTLPQVLPLGRNKLYELVARPDFPAFRVGKTILIPRAALEKWLEQQAAKEKES